MQNIHFAYCKIFYRLKRGSKEPGFLFIVLSGNVN